MKTPRLSLPCVLSLIVGLTVLLTTRAEDKKPPVGSGAVTALLGKDARLAIAGDSITEQKLYSKYMEAYILACAGRRDVHVFQFGWGGETAGGFAGRMENDLSVFKPTVVTLCYGMNDGGYRPFDEKSVGAGYEQNTRTILKKLQELGIKNVVVGSPGAVDSKFFGKQRSNFGSGDATVGYNDSLANLGAIDKKLAGEFKFVFADVHTPMMESMAKGKAALGDDYDVCGTDGVHPHSNGQLVMAYAFLKGLGLDGNIGEIVVDMKGDATATEGHKVLSAKGGKVELESERYPFCFDGDAKTSNGTRSILPFLPFNQDLNRLTLKVKNLPGDKAKVTWGKETKEFTKEQLQAGINLAAEFSKTPFDEAFQTLLQAIAVKQNFETGAIKNFVTNFRWASNEFKNDEAMQTALDGLRKKIAARYEQLHADVLKAVTPQKYTITIEP
jgi:lysophospholipase L1-like esterase